MRILYHSVILEPILEKNSKESHILLLIPDTVVFLLMNKENFKSQLVSVYIITQEVLSD